MEDKVISELKKVYDPEMPVNIYDLGLIYDISFEKAYPTWNPLNKSTGKKCKILMTLTSAWCPEAQSIPIWVRDAALNVEEIVGCEVEVTFDPPWSQECMSELAKLEIGLI
jgi:metal-sulfur cluster biosynthetic enzyme